MTLGLLQNLVDLLTGSLWTYPLLFGICAGDALIPAFPSETALIVCGIQAARGNLSLEWVIVCAAAGRLRRRQQSRTRSAAGSARRP